MLKIFNKGHTKQTKYDIIAKVGKDVDEMEEKIKNQSINRLCISDDTIKLLQENNTKTIGQLCKKSKRNLSELKLDQSEIDKIEFELQLLGLNLKNAL